MRSLGNEELHMQSTAIHSCSRCAMSTLCLPLGIDKDDIGELENLVDSTQPIRGGNTIFRQGDEFTKIYAVKSGSLKSVYLDENGDEQITAFHLPGELVGLDGIYPEQYTTSTIRCTRYSRPAALDQNALTGSACREGMAWR